MGKSLSIKHDFNLREVLFDTYLREKEQIDFCLPRKGKKGKAVRGPLPNGMEKFIESDLFVDLAQNILEYTFYLIRLEDRKRQLEIDSKQRNIPVPRILKAEEENLQDKAKRMSDNYGRLIFSYTSLGALGDAASAMEKLHSNLQFRTKISSNNQNDKMFYEGIIRIYTKALKRAFDELDRYRVEEEVHRLFRSQTFNKSTRDH